MFRVSGFVRDKAKDGRTPKEKCKMQNAKVKSLYFGRLKRIATPSFALSPKLQRRNRRARNDGACKIDCRRELNKRNIQRFPFDFMFRLTIDEWEFIRSQIATASSNDKNMWSQNVTASQQIKANIVR